jgi:hypothetical protein
MWFHSSFRHAASHSIMSLTLRMVTTGTVGKPLGDATSGFRIVEVGHDKLCDHHYGLGSLPNQVNLSMAACEVDKGPPQ